MGERRVLKYVVQSKYNAFAEAFVDFVDPVFALEEAFQPFL